MIALAALAAFAVLRLNDPPAPIQLLAVSATQRGGDLQICVEVRNESPDPVSGIGIDGSVHDGTGSEAEFYTGVQFGDATHGSLMPGMEARRCTTVTGLTIRRDAVIQIGVSLR